MWPDTFLSASRLYALLGVVAVAVAYAVLAFVRRSYTIRFTNLALLETVAPRRPGWRRHLTAAALVVSLALLVLAWARPADEVRVSKERATVVLAIDTSLSMEATDVRPSRIEAARDAALQFVADLPEQINLGLVTFDGIARIRVTPTTDRELVTAAIDDLRLGQATAIGEAILASLDAIESTPYVDPEGNPVPGRIVLMTDGKTTVGRPDADGAQAAREKGIPVSTIAFGTENGTILIDGELQPVPVASEPLELIASETGGQFFSAESLGELEQVYADIGSSIGFDVQTRETTERWTGFALGALVLSTLLSLAWFQRLP